MAVISTQQDPVVMGMMEKGGVDQNPRSSRTCGAQRRSGAVIIENVPPSTASCTPTN